MTSKLVSITESRLSTWFVNNYLRKWLCSDRVSRLFDDVSTSTKLQNAVSAIVEWRLNTTLQDLCTACATGFGVPGTNQNTNTGNQVNVSFFIIVNDVANWPHSTDRMLPLLRELGHPKDLAPRSHSATWTWSRRVASQRVARERWGHPTRASMILCVRFWHFSYVFIHRNDSVTLYSVPPGSASRGQTRTPCLDVSQIWKWPSKLWRFLR